MRYRDAAAFRQALEQRLRARAGGDGARLARDRKRVAFERLLARLNEVAPEEWILKGGFALDLRLADRARATRDVDLDWQTGEEELAEKVIEAAEVSGDDFFTFQIERTAMQPERLGGSHRFRVRASLADRLFETFLLDIGLRSSLVSEHDTLTTTDILSFAEIEPVEVPAVPLERHIAEKLHAYTRRYGDDQPSSRVKDLIDIVLMSDLASFDYDQLRIPSSARSASAERTSCRRRCLHRQPTGRSRTARWLLRSGSIPISRRATALPPSSLIPSCGTSPISFVGTQKPWSGARADTSRRGHYAQRNVQEGLVNYRGSYRKLRANAKAAMLAAIEIYNEPRFEYRDEVFVILLLNAWELLLKARKRTASPDLTFAIGTRRGYKIALAAPVL